MANQVKYNELLLGVGDLIVVQQKIQEGDKTRNQPFQGQIIAIKGNHDNRTITVRKISSGIGVERIWPINSPWVTKITLKKKGDVRRAKLYYTRRLHAN